MASERVEYHHHAMLRMGERKVAEHQVRRTLNDPHRLRSGHSGRTVAERDTEASNVIRVVYEVRDDGATAFVWTVIRLSG